MAIVSYEVSINNGPWFDLADAASPVTVSGLAPETTYDSFRLRSRDEAGNVSEASEAVGPATTDAALPPVGLRYNIGSVTAYGSFLGDPGTSFITGTHATSPDAAAVLTGLTDPAPAGVYQSIRYTDPGQSYTYNLTVNPSETYLIRVHINATNVNRDPTIISINGVAQPSFNPWAEGGSVTNKGVIKEYTITQGATTAFTLKVEGSGNYPSISGLEILQVVPMSIATRALPEATKDAAYTFTLTTDDEIGAVTWAVVSGTLPAGLSLNASTGAITGTPTALSSTTILFSATDSEVTVQRLLRLDVDQPPASYLLDDIADTPMMAYSTRKLKAAYAGAAFRVRRPSDDTETDIGFNANGNLDRTEMIEFGSSLEIVKWYDQMAFKDLNESSSAPIPAYSHFLSKRDGIDYGSAKVIEKGMVTSGTVTVNAPKVFIAANTRTTDTGWKTTGGLYYFDFAGNNFNGTARSGALNLYNANQVNCGRFDGGKHQLTFWYTTGDDKIVLDGTDRLPAGISGTATNAGDDPRTKAFALGNYGLGGLDQNFQGVFGEVILFDGAVTDKAAIEASQSDYFLDNTPVAPSSLAYTKRVHLEGDSRTFGFNNTADSTDVASWAARLEDLLDSSWSIRNVANSGQHVVQYDEQGPFTIDAYYNASLLKNVVVVWGVVNAFALSPGVWTGTEMFDAMKAYVQDRQAAGFEVIICTDPDSQGYMASGDRTEYIAYNALLRGDHAWADGFVDLELVTELSDATNTTYFTDGTHLKIAGAEVVAEAVEPVLIAL